jgi:hypothetical protein
MQLYKMLTEEIATDKNPPVRVGVSVITPVSWKSAKTDLEVRQKITVERRTRANILRRTIKRRQR